MGASGRLLPSPPRDQGPAREISEADMKLTNYVGL